MQVSRRSLRDIFFGIDLANVGGTLQTIFIVLPVLGYLHDQLGPPCTRVQNATSFPSKLGVVGFF